jgi:hypothetical protein
LDAFSIDSVPDTLLVVLASGFLLFLIVIGCALILIALAQREDPPGEVKEVKVDDKPLTVAFDNQGAICPVCRALIPVVHDDDAVVDHVLREHPLTQLASELRELRGRGEEATGA